MCRSCGCDDHHHDHDHDHHHHHHEPRRIALEVDLLAKNDRLAGDVRLQLQRDHITAFNLIGAPGAGKTALLERTIGELLDDLPVAVLEGDQATDRDAKRIAATGAPVVQINTGAGCHLDATMVERGLAELRPRPSSLLFVENVGNLVCPALFDVGEHAKVVVMSVTEGEDKPLKYPHVIGAASALVITKTDLLPHVDVSLGLCIANARRINPDIEVFAVCAPRGDGMSDWCGWLRARAGSS
jgi:hydrogenase nickel incorporation protein HypB